MEILFELLLGLLEVLAELLLQLLFELGARSLAVPLQRKTPWHPAWAALGYIGAGAAAGGLSLWLFPALWVTTPGLRLANLVVTPILSGAVMAGLGALRARRNAPTVTLDRFAYGYLFALAMAGVRYAFGH